MAESEKTRTTAWPLIMMAIVAGGLPLLWANRALLPTPETWKSSASEAAKPTQVVPPTLPLKAAPPPPALAPQVVSTDSVAATSPAAAVPSGDAASSKSSAGPDNAKSTAKEKKNPGAKAGNASRKTGKTPAPEQPPPCTEATVALGLCDAKRAGK